MKEPEKSQAIPGTKVIAALASTTSEFGGQFHSSSVDFLLHRCYLHLCHFAGTPLLDGTLS